MKSQSLAAAALSLLITVTLVSPAESQPINESSLSMTTTLSKKASERKVNQLFNSTPEKKGWKAVARHIRTLDKATSSGKHVSFDVLMSPTVDKKKVRQAVKSYERAMTLWYPLGVSEVDLRWIFLSEKDYEWWLNEVKTNEQNPDTKVWNPKTNIFGHCLVNPKAFCGYGSPKPSGTTYQYNLIGSKYDQAPNKNTVAHEATHFYHDSIDSQLLSKSPCWFVEGQAQLIGNALSPEGLSSRARMDQLQLIINVLPGSDEFTEAQWVNQLNRLKEEQRGLCIETQLAYPLGMLIFEYLYGAYSFKQVHSLVLATSEESSFDLATKRALSISESEFFQRAARYIVSTID